MYRLVILLACGFGCIANLTAAEQPMIPPPLSVTDALMAFHLRPGFEIELVAAEPLVADPVAIAWGADGKLWVVEMGDYPLGVDGKGKPGGNVKFLEDIDSDGNYDRATVFLEGLAYPTGVLPWRSGVLISAAPEIFYAEDRDGDGRADHRETILRGFGEGNQQHRVNGLRFGLDNWVHCANGDSGGSIESIKSGEKVQLGRRDFRFQPDIGKVEPVTGQTQFGLDTDDWGHWFGSSNSRPLTHYALDDRYLRRNPHATARLTAREIPDAAGAAPVFPTSTTVARFNDLNKANRFTSACGCAIYRDELFGGEYLGNSFVCEPVHNLLHREIVRADGGSFRSRRADDEQQSEFLSSTDPWFRPVMARSGPDGALWVVDMYRAVVEHPEWIPREWQKQLDLRAGHDRGRIYRVYPVEREPRAIPNLARRSTEQLVEALSDTSGTVRDLARQLLVERNDTSVIPALRSVAMRSSIGETQVQALATLEALGGIRPSLIAHSIRDPLARVRAMALRLAEPMLSNPVEAIKEEWYALAEDMRHRARDEYAVVRFQAALSLGYWRDPQAGALLGELALRESGDPFVVGAVISSLHADNLEAVARQITAAEVKASQRVVLFESLTTTAAGLDHAASLAVLLDWAVPIDKPSSVEQLAAVTTLLDAFDRKGRKLDQLAKLLPEPISRLQQLLSTAPTTARHTKAPVEQRIAAVGLLGRINEQQADHLKLLGNLLGPQSPAALRDAGISALARIGAAATPSILLQHWNAATPSFREQIVETLLGREPWTDALLGAIERNEVHLQDMSALQWQRLLQHRKPEFRDRTRKQFDRLRSSTAVSSRAEVLDQFASALELTGDTARGSKVFEKRCAACHRLGEVGHVVGPDLTALGDKSPRSLLVAILDPNRAVESKFVVYTAITTDGRTLTGMLVDEAGDSITLLANEGKRVTLARSEIEEFASGNKSLMPEGLEKDVTAQDLADCIALVANLRAKRKAFAGNEPAVVRAEALRNEFYLLATQAEIYGSTLVFEPTYKNLGYWQSADDHAIWTIDAPAAGEYELSLEYACDVQSAGNTVVVAIGDRQLRMTVASSGSWSNFTSTVLGTVSLVAGPQRLLVRSDGKPRGALFDLKSVRLRPVK